MIECLCNGEPTLREMLEDPTVQQVMASDGIARTELETLMGGVAPARGSAERPAGGCRCASSESRWSAYRALTTIAAGMRKDGGDSLP